MQTQFGPFLAGALGPAESKTLLAGGPDPAFTSRPGFFAR